jgi:uncharacterized membrane protein
VPAPGRGSRTGADVPVGFDPTVRTRRAIRVRKALRRRRRLRNGLVQALFVIAALALAFGMPELDAEPHVDGGRIATMMFSFAGGLIALITVVFSLLFLVVPAVNTSLTPRLTLFRDDPVVWRSFAFFVGLFVFFSASGFALSNDEEVSYLVAVLAVLLVLAAAFSMRTLQFHAYRSLQFGPTIIDITDAGERLLGVLYEDELDARDGPAGVLPLVETEMRWPNGLCVLRQIDVPNLVEFATTADAVVDVRVRVGEELRRDVVVFAVRGNAAADPERLWRMIETGADRSFDQDPLFAFRLLVDIALRSVSSAINDPITAVQAIAGIHQLLHDLIDRDLDIGRVADAGGRVRVVVNVPSWEDYLAVGVDEIAPYVGSTPQVERRLAEMLDALLAEAPPPRRPALEARRFRG